KMLFSPSPEVVLEPGAVLICSGRKDQLGHVTALGAGPAGAGGRAPLRRRGGGAARPRADPRPPSAPRTPAPGWRRRPTARATPRRRAARRPLAGATARGS